jgi:hypothetical protein
VRTHLLRLELAAADCAALFAAARALDLRIGWLELTPLAAPAPVPPSLAGAADAGALRAVAIGGERSVAVKPMRGAPVLKDVLREHFAGCALVLIQGDVDLPKLEREGERWRVRLDEESRAYTTEQLARALRRPRAFDFETADEETAPSPQI